MVHWSLCYNQTEKHPDNYQLDSTAILLMNMIAHQTQAPSANPSSLGWWRWVKILGKNNQAMHIFSLYWPCKSDGLMSTSQQYVRALTKVKHDKCPKQVVVKDITISICQWQEEGDSIIT